METLELTKEHKSKLLEMCKVLFPQYSKCPKTRYGGIGFHHHDGTHGLPFIRDSEYLWFFKPEDGDLYDMASFCCHWFEFCTSVLPKIFYSLYDNFTNGNGINFQEIMYKECIILNKSHPVDYLYLKFKIIREYIRLDYVIDYDSFNSVIKDMEKY